MTTQPTPQPTPNDRPQPDEQAPTQNAPQLIIEGCSHRTIVCYFETLNRGDFEATAALFAEDGALVPPFEEAVVGPGAIATYLHAEATGMRLHPRRGTLVPTETGDIQYEIRGHVQTALFGVNVGWLFVLSANDTTRDDTIKLVRVKLLASPQELLNLRR